MAALLLLPLLLASLGNAQQVLLAGRIAQPAAGPDFGQSDLARTLLPEDDLLKDGAHEPTEGLIGPEGRQVIGPLKAQQLLREEELRREAAEIARVLTESSQSSSTPWSTWLASLAGCLCVVACGVLPAFLLPANASEYLHSEEGKQKLNLLLSFAVGSLLGDVFLHLLPETWAAVNVDERTVGLWTLAGLLICFAVEKLCATTIESQHQICAIMNLIANFVDNFTHGLAVGGSFLVGLRFGALTTFAILVHEIPHEISDFAILLRADFDRWSAVKAQLFTAVGGVLGASMALWLHSDSVLEGAAAWILPFTAGGFVNIALGQILPELMHERSSKQNVKQLAYILGGVVVMAALNHFHLP